MTDETAQQQDSQELDLGTNVATDATNEANEATEATEVKDQEEGLDLGMNLDREPEEEEEPKEPDIPLPEKYEIAYENKDDALLKSIDESMQSIFKEAKLTQEQAQIIADSLDRELVNNLRESIEDQHKQWRVELAKNPMFRGDQYKASEKGIKTVLKTVLDAEDSSPQLKDWVKTNFYPKSESNPHGQGLINNPLIAEFIAFVGKKLSPDTAVTGVASAPQKELTGDDASLMRARLLKESVSGSFNRFSTYRDDQQEKSNNSLRG